MINQSISPFVFAYLIDIKVAAIIPIERTLYYLSDHRGSNAQCNSVEQIFSEPCIYLFVKTSSNILFVYLGNRESYLKISLRLHWRHKKNFKSLEKYDSAD